jgi:dephospho-CoA kinase
MLSHAHTPRVSKRVGLTGGIGCGKSTVLGFFEAEGWRTLKTDSIAGQLLAENVSVRESLLERWGGSILSAQGAVDRKAVAARVFAHREELDFLESILHPLVRSSWEAQLAADPEAAWLVEIPLLFEKSLETRFDLTVCVRSPDDIVASRMRARAFSGEELAKRRERQLPIDEKTRKADFVISNAGNLEFLQTQTMRLIELLHAS